MSPFGAYILGLITFLLILIPFWIAGVANGEIGTIYKNSVCYKICD